MLNTKHCVAEVHDLI